jgi:chitodextrinase
METLLLFPLLALALAACGGGPGLSGGTTVSADTTAPSIPGNFTAVAAGSTAANLSWNASTDNVGVADYIVHRNGAQVATPTTVNYVDTGLSAGATYSYTVSARDAAGNTSPNSPNQSVTTAVAPPADTVPPSVPTNLAATPGANAISLTWSASTDNVAVTGYTVHRNGTPVAMIAATGYVDSGLIASTAYAYTVSAFDAAGNASAQTAAVTATTLAAGTQTALGALAKLMQPGQWADFTMGGLDSSVVGAASSSTPSLLTFAARGVWDPVHNKIQFAGVSHTGGPVVAGAGGLITWDDATNQWGREAYAWSSDTPGHAYYHLALNAGNGDLYYRMFGQTRILRRVYGASGQASWQTGQVADQPSTANQVAGGLQWFPSLNGGQGGLVFVDVFGAAWSNAAIASWQLQKGTSMSGNYQNWIALAGPFVYWGGGSGASGQMYRLSSTGVVTTMPNTPINPGVNTDPAIVLSHPNGTDLLLFETGVASGAIYRFNGSAWTNVGTHQINSANFWIGAPVPIYGVIVFIVHPGGNGTPYARVYKP